MVAICTFITSRDLTDVMHIQEGSKNQDDAKCSPVKHTPLAIETTYPAFGNQQTNPEKNFLAEDSLNCEGQK